MAQDFGRTRIAEPRAVARPPTPAHLRDVHRHGVGVTIRGRGYSVDGQTLAPNGLVIDMSALDEVHVDPVAKVVRAGSGATWRSVLTATLEHGLTPPVVVDFLDLCVGGTLSVGGISGSSTHHGMQVDQVTSLDVIDAAGTPRTCSPDHQAELFHAVLAGHGRHGVIVDATLRLIDAPSRVRRVRATYASLEPFLRAQRAGVARWTHVDGRAGFERDGQLAFTLEGIVPAGDRLADRPVWSAAIVETFETSYDAFVERADAMLEAQRADGSWSAHHPRVTMLLPYAAGASLVASLVAGLTPPDLGPGGSLLLYPLLSRHVHRHPMPRSAWTLVCGLQRTAPLGDTDTLDGLLAANTDFVDRARRIGAVPYGVIHPGDRLPRVSPIPADTEQSSPGDSLRDESGTRSLERDEESGARRGSESADDPTTTRSDRAAPRRVARRERPGATSREPGRGAR